MLAAVVSLLTVEPRKVPCCQSKASVTSGAAVARRYADFIDAFLIDAVDALPEPLPGVTFLSAPTLMNSTEDRLRLADAALQAADALKTRRPPG